MKITVTDEKGKKIEDIELDKVVFGQEPNDDLLLQYLHIYKSNQRQGTSSAKTRSEVSGGGKKPWKQKGTGRARAGSIRSPIWRHGGVAHGPKPKSWNLKMPKKMKKRAMQCALTSKYNMVYIKLRKTLFNLNPATKEVIN